MSLSLILHELAINAVKYEALSAPEGRVSLTWEVIDGATMRLQWMERGGPPVVTPTRTGFGTRLIGRGLAGNFGGTVTLEYPTIGVICTIVAPAEGLQAEDTPQVAASSTTLVSNLMPDRVPRPIRAGDVA